MSNQNPSPRKMSLLLRPSLSIPSLRPPTRRVTIFPNIPLPPSPYYFFQATTLRCSAFRRSLLSTEEEVLEAIACSDGENVLPCVRTYENEMAQLSLVGAVDFQQALTAGAADGGEAANEHVQSGLATMVVETVFPGPPEDHSTISTRLFLPTKKVIEKARKLRRSFSKEMMNSTTSENILAMTFRQVVLKQLWSFQLVLFEPGTERNIEDLKTPREVTATLTLSSSDQRPISVLAEAISALVLQSTEEQFLESSGKSSNSLFRLSKSGREMEFSSKDSTVTIYRISEDDIVRNAKRLLENFNAADKEMLKNLTSRRNFNAADKEMLKNLTSRRKNHAKWKPSTMSSLAKVGGSEFCTWVTEYLRVYRLQIKPEGFGELKFEGGQQLAGRSQEVLLTQSQMAALTNLLDMYYEDAYTLPDKNFPCSLAMNPSTLSNRKVSPLLGIFSVAIVAAVIFAVSRVVSPKNFPHLQWKMKHLPECTSLSSEEADR